MLRTAPIFVPGIQPQHRGFGRAGGGGGGPIMTGLVLWLRALDLTLSNNDTVTSWPDTSGNGNTPSITGSPVFKTGIIGGKPVVRFAAAPYLSFVDFSALTAGHMFMVFQNGTNGNGDFIYQLASSSNDVKSYVPFSGNGGIYDSFFSTTRRDNTGSGSLASGANIYDVASGSGEWSNYVNGVQKFTTGTNTVSAPSAGTFAHNLNGEWNGDLAEILLYSSILSSGDQTTNYAYLNGEYSIF